MVGNDEDLIYSIPKEFVEIEKEYLLSFYTRQNLLIERGEGCWIYSAGRKYLDLVAGIAAVSLGHCHPVYVERIYDQLKKLVHVSNLYYTSPQLELAINLRKISGMNSFFFCNSGTEAVEGALKISRKVTGKKKFVALEGSFHGRTLGSLSITYKEKFRKPFEPLLEPVEFCKFNDVDDLNKKIDENTAAVILEPIQGESGVREVSGEFIEEVFEKKEEYGYVVIFDEVQTGFGRTGKWFGKDHFDFQPDIITMAKAMGSGFPIGAIGTTEEIAMKVGAGEHASTFGGNPLACSAALATIEIMHQENLVENSARMGEYFRKRLSELELEIRGKGLMIGMDLKVPEAVEAVKKALEMGVLINNTSETTLRFVPPLIISKGEVDFAMSILEKLLKSG
jgi:acetylornithine/N-succinyldiaminopimelate aminotransferase